MPVSEVSRPAGLAKRRASRKFDAKEIEAAVKLLDAGKTPGVGPHDEQKSCRSELGALKREIVEASTYAPEDLGTQAWEDPSDQKWYGCVRVK